MKSTKLESYLTFPRQERDAEVYHFLINSDGDLIRDQIVTGIDRRESTVSGCLNRLGACPQFS